MTPPEFSYHCTCVEQNRSRVEPVLQFRSEPHSGAKSSLPELTENGWRGLASVMHSGTLCSIDKSARLSGLCSCRKAPTSPALCAAHLVFAAGRYREIEVTLPSIPTPSRETHTADLTHLRPSAQMVRLNMSCWLARCEGVTNITI